MSVEKYILSIYWSDHRHEIFSEPHGLFNTLDEAENFIEERIDEIKTEFIELYDEDYVNEYIHCDYTIKSIFIKVKISINSDDETSSDED